MGGFNYGGGKGDGTPWSSERGEEPKSGGGARGNGGDRDNSGSSSNAGTAQSQLNAVRNDPAIRNMLVDLLRRTRSISPSAKVTLIKLDKQGVLGIMVSGVSREQINSVLSAFGAVTPVIKNDPVTTVDTNVFGAVDTGHKLGDSQNNLGNNHNRSSAVAENKVSLDAYSAVLRGEIPAGFWLDNDRVMTEVVTSYEISGGGKGNGRTGYRKSKEEVSSLTDAYRQWKQIQNDAAQEDERRKAEEEARRKAEEDEARRRQVEWDAQHQEEAAQRQINEAQQRMNQAQQDKSAAEQRAAGHDSAANNAQGEQNALRQEQQRHYDEHMKLVNGGALRDTRSPRFRAAMQLIKASEDAKSRADAKQNDINREHDAASQARNEANQAQQRVEQSQREKAEAESRLNGLRAERQVREAAEAKRRADEEAAKAAAEAKRKAEEEAKEKEEVAVKDAVKFTADFYKEVFKGYGEKAEQLAKSLANQAKGKKIRNVEDALKSYEKYKANINKKINAKDREAIAKVLESVDVGKTAKNIAKFSKGLGYVGPAIDVVDWVTELIKAVKTDNWRSLYVKTETIAIGLAATHVTALAFGAILGGPVGILGYGLIMAGVGALVNETIVDEANKVIGI